MERWRTKERERKRERDIRARGERRSCKENNVMESPNARGRVENVRTFH